MGRHTIGATLATLAALWLLGCGSEAGGGPDTVAPDVLASGDVGEETAGPLCEMPDPIPQDTPDPNQSKFALALFHYNLQYVAGGLEYVDDEGVTHSVYSPMTDGWHNDALEDWIIRETFEPVVDFYLAHPDWQVNLEMQSLMLEVIAERFPDLLEKLRVVTWRGQVELVSFHHSDQLFLAYPREDMRRSIVETKAIFERLCLPLSPAVFNQEGQAGEGRQQMLVDEGYETGVFPKNLWIYQHGDGLRWPWYTSKGGTLIVGPGEVDPASGVEVTWTFLDDGELLAPTDGLDPYFAAVAVHDPARMEAYGAELQALVDQGYRISHVTDYVRHLEARGLSKPAAPPLLDGTWQPPSTESVLRWMGGRGVVWPDDERDNEVRTGNYRARTELLFAQTLRDHAAGEGVLSGEVDARLHQAWRDLWKAQVSDASGINPWKGEIYFGLKHNRLVEEAAAEVITTLKEALATPWVAIDTATGQITPLADRPAPEPPEAAAAQLPLAFGADAREVGERWYRAWTDTECYEIHLDFSAVTRPPAAGEQPRLLTLAVPRTEERIRYSPALIEDEVVDYGFDEFAWNRGDFYLPLANGLIGLGDDLWLIKDTRAMHLAARLAPDDDFVRFRDETVQPDESYFWRLLLCRGSAAEALAEATKLNIWPADIR